MRVMGDRMAIGQQHQRRGRDMTRTIWDIATKGKIVHATSTRERDAILASDARAWVVKVRPFRVWRRVKP